MTETVARKIPRKYAYIFLGWTLLVIASLAWNLHQLGHTTLNTAATAARASLAKDIGLRNWASSHGGVYVSPTAHIPPNPYLKVSDRDVVTTTGMVLTLMNPAYIVREVQQDFSGGVSIKSHLTSLKLFNPKNAPDEWETKVLKSFDQGNKEALEVSEIDGKPYLRLMLPLPITEGCLKCHNTQDYKIGDNRGGIGASVLLQPYTEVELVRSSELALSHGVIWLIGLLGMGFSYRREQSADAQREKAAEKINDLAFYDQLTRLPNRHLLLDRLAQALALSVRSKQQGALLFINLDNFKYVNDTQGHAVGDLLLIEVAKRLQGCTREGDSAARQGGDEFFVLVENLGTDEQAAAIQANIIGEKILDTLGKDYTINGNNYHSTASIGLTQFCGSVITMEEIIKRANLALHRAKADGRNTMRFFDPALQVAIMARVALEADLRCAVSEQEQFLLYYQPQVDSSGHMIGAEALVRWRHPVRGMVSPGEFIPLAEETGLILPLGHWVMTTACQQLAAWRAQPEASHLTIAVNVSAKQFSLPTFVEEVLELVNYFNIDPAKLKLEVTESLMVDNLDEIISKMNTLSDKGLKFSLDDFGTGYSSLQYLRRLPFYQLKIDQSFVRDITTNDSAKAIVRTIISMAYGMNLNVIAEGVETEAQLSLLEQLGCMAYQGYFFSKPVPIEQFEEVLKECGEF